MTTEEQEFLAAYDASGFPHPSLTVDVALLTIGDDELEALLVRRTDHPHRGRLALPGSFVGADESLEKAASRALKSKANVSGVFLEQLYTFAAPKRDPRTRVVTVAYFALVTWRRMEPVVATLPEEARLYTIRTPWAGESGGPVEVLDPEGYSQRLAFDHADILGLLVKRLRGKLNYTDVAFELLPERFTLRDLQRVHETILGRAVNKDSFRRRMLASGRLLSTGEREQDVSYRPAELYRRNPEMPDN